MIKLSTIIGILMLMMLALAVYKVEQNVQSMERELARMKRQIQQEEYAVHVLEAEWSYLSSPARLKQLAREHLNLRDIGMHQIVAIEDIPMRDNSKQTASKR